MLGAAIGGGEVGVSNDLLNGWNKNSKDIRLIIMTFDILYHLIEKLGAI